MSKFINFLLAFFTTTTPAYIVTSTTLLEDGETWEDTQTRMTQGELNSWFARIRPDLAAEYSCKGIELEPGASMGLGTGQYESLFFIERV